MDSIIKRIKVLLCVAVFSVFVPCVALAFAPLSGFAPDRITNVLETVVGALFWLGIVVSVTITLLIKIYLLRLKRRTSVERQLRRQKLPGILTFIPRRNHLILYGIFVIGLLLIVADIKFEFISQFIMFPILAGTIFAFAMHCIVDGKLYRLYKSIKEGKRNGH